MAVIVVATGLAGFAASVALLALGVASMPVRYVLAVAVAYAVFLLLVRVWIGWQRRRITRHLDAIDLVPDLPGGGPGVEDAPWEGGGGRFGGGGAGRSWGDGEAPAAEAGSILPDVGPALDVDLDEGAAVLVPVAILVGGVLVSVYVVWTAPALLAELLLDVALTSSLYRRLRKLEPESWLATAVRRTWMPVTAVALLVACGGAAMQWMVPGADSIGDVLNGGRPR
jgi:hypothetical protein